MTGKGTQREAELYAPHYSLSPRHKAQGRLNLPLLTLNLTKGSRKRPLFLSFPLLFSKVDASFCLFLSSTGPGGLFLTNSETGVWEAYKV